MSIPNHNNRRINRIATNALSVSQIFILNQAVMEFRFCDCLIRLRIKRRMPSDTKPHCNERWGTSNNCFSSMSMTRDVIETKTIVRRCPHIVIIIIIAAVRCQTTITCSRLSIEWSVHRMHEAHESSESPESILCAELHSTNITSQKSAIQSEHINSRIKGERKKFHNHSCEHAHCISTREVICAYNGPGHYRLA